MRIEDITKEKLAKAHDEELTNLKLRFTQLWDKEMKKSLWSLSVQNGFLKKYRLLLNEIKSRKLESSTCAIDRATFKKAMAMKKFGIDVTDFDDIVIASNCIAVDTVSIDIEKVEKLVEERRQCIFEMFKREEERENTLFENAYIPIYDLVLRPKQETIKVEVEKTKSRRMWSAKYISKLPDSAFLYTEPRGEGDGMQIMRRCFPYKGNDGEVDLFHLKKAIENIPLNTRDLSESIKTELQTKANGILEDIKEGKVFEKFISVYPIDKADKDERIVCGIVYEPDVVDSQGDKANATEIRKAAYQFMEKVQVFRVNHEGKGVKVRVLESYVAPVDFKVSDKAIKKGTWVLTVRVLDKKIWEAVKSGDLTGFSMAGYARAV